jgi:hypothetical protein
MHIATEQIGWADDDSLLNLPSFMLGLYGPRFLGSGPDLVLLAKWTGLG